MKSEPGIEKGLQLVLDAHSNHISSGTIFDNFKGFKVIVGDRKKFPLTGMDGLVLKNGQENYVSINPTNVVADEGIRKISPLNRECYFSNENPAKQPLEFFKNYSQANCLLECRIKHVKNEMNSSCTPWYFPGILLLHTLSSSILMFPIIAVKDDSLRMCDPWDTIEFLDKMKHIPEDKCDYCLPDCNITIYETTVSSAPFQSCDHTNLESSNMCKLTSGKGFNPPLWINEVKTQFKGMNWLFCRKKLILGLII